MNENKQRGNALVLFLDTRLLVAVSGLASQKKQGSKTYILNLITEACKTELSPETYQELKAKYMLTVEDQKKLKAEKLQQKIAKEERKLKALELNAEAYKKQTQISVERAQTEIYEKITELRKEETRYIRQLKDKFEEHIHDTEWFNEKQLAQIEAKLKDTQAQIQGLNTQLEALQSVTK